jgi:RNA-directed DNA polymerase
MVVEGESEDPGSSLSVFVPSDGVNHDRLMAAVGERVADKRMLQRIRAFLEAGVMEDGLVSPGDEGTPQGGPVTPLTQKVISSLNE